MNDTAPHAHPTGRLTGYDHDEIRAAHAAGISIDQLAEEYHRRPNTIRRIVRPRSGTAMTLLERFKEAAAAAYNECGPDLGWNERSPDDDEFVDVIRDLMHTRLHPADARAWERLTVDAKRRIILSVGP